MTKHLFIIQSKAAIRSGLPLPLPGGIIGEPHMTSPLGTYPASSMPSTTLTISTTLVRSNHHKTLPPLSESSKTQKLLPPTMSSYSYSSTSHTSSSTTSDGQTHSKSETTRSSYNDRDGGNSERVISETGKPTRVETAQAPAGGQHIGSGTSGQNRIEDVTDKQGDLSEADKQYLERMEDEYAKREGGA